MKLAGIVLVSLAGRALTCSSKKTVSKPPGKPLTPENFEAAHSLEASAYELPKTFWQLDDIIFEEGESLGNRNAARNVRKWPNKIVPYEVESDFTNNEKDIIAAGIAEIQDNTCVEFRSRTDEPNYVIFGGRAGNYLLRSLNLKCHR